MRKLIEPAKTVLIVLLIISAFFFAYKTDLFKPLASVEPFASVYRIFGNIFSDSPAYELQNNDVELKQASLPLAIAATNSSGRYAVMCDEDGVQAAYDSASYLLREAIGSAEAPSEMTEQEWKVALSSPGIYFYYGFNLPLSVLAAWLDVEFDTPFFADAILLSRDDSDHSLLCFASENKFYCAATSALFRYVSEETENYRPNDSKFAFETEKDMPVYKNISPYTIIPFDSLSLCDVKSENNLSEQKLHTLMEALSLNPYTESSYVDTDGNSVYVFGQNTLRANSSSVTYSTVSQNASGSQTSSSAAELIENARLLIEKTLGSDSGAAKIYLSGFSQNDDTVEISFSYRINGVPVCFGSGCTAASITFTSGELSAFKMIYRKYSFTEKLSSLLPTVFAASIARPDLRYYIFPAYSDAVDSSLSANWFYIGEASE